MTSLSTTSSSTCAQPPTRRNISIEQITAPVLLSSHDLSRLTSSTTANGCMLNASSSSPASATQLNRLLFKNKSYSFLMSKHLMKKTGWSTPSTSNSSSNSLNNHNNSTYNNNSNNNGNGLNYKSFGNGSSGVINSQLNTMNNTMNNNNSINRRNFLKTRTSLSFYFFLLFYWLKSQMRHLFICLGPRGQFY
jgi:hypothetical protein